MLMEEQVNELKAEKFLITGIDFETKEEALQYVGNYLYEKGFVKESFTQALLDREKVYPTGLPTEPIRVAIPHADVEHVNKPAIAVTILNKPLEFHNMADNQSTEEVNIIFVLAIKTPKSQIDLLQKLMEFFESGEKLKELTKVKNIEELENIFAI
jgi:galactitol PTS system EIIA component